ncbi:cadherin-86C [Sitophilus oryzae]|uniref:Cadherin-86C n=1 Tax=Sitophilus oryzae TaxID=7048 RepID=A0A6J2XLF2_SITOR|nr:cadherin-86C [Sitophilus oryzae]
MEYRKKDKGELRCKKKGKSRGKNSGKSTGKTSCQLAMRLLVFVWCYYCGSFTVSAVLVFDSTALLNEILIPADAAVGSVIYRLRVSDTAFDYPLIFDLKETTTVAVEALNCTRFNSVCQANVILRKKLEAGRFYDFKVEIRNQRGQSATMNCSFFATNATTPIEKIFPGAPSLLTISENARRNTELGSIIAKGNPNRMKSVYLELYGTLEFGIHQKLISEKDAEGTIILFTPLDYETKTVHHLTVLANDPWTNMQEDTRNIAGWPLLVAVIDEQDTPPIFTIAPPTTTLSPTLKPGDIILRVHAEDGDRGQPRAIRYSLDHDNPTSTLFEIEESSGELTLSRPMSHVMSLSNQGQPILLKVTAEEVRSNPQEAPSQSTTVQLALIPPGITTGSPTFGAIEYHALLDENSPVGTDLDLPQAEITTEPGDVVTLELQKNNGTFDISPSVVEGFARFRITVHDNRLLDYEARHYVECFIVAKELGKGNYTARAKLTVVLNDVNDNPPRFVKSEFRGNVPEHAAVGTTVLIVEATDVDREPGSKIRYMELSGEGSDLFNLDPETGLVTVANSDGLDAETFPTISLIVTAADESGEGLTATSKILINLLDINDHAPKFEKDIYEFILNTDRLTFTTQAFIKAFDNDISPPNNVVMYQLITPNENLFVNEKTGEILVKKAWDNDELVTLRAQAYDEGVPRLSSECEIRIYPPESKSRKMVFILPGKYQDKYEAEKTLSALTGGTVEVNEVRPYTGFEPGATYVTREQNGEKSVVVATVHYTKDSVVDVNRIQQLLDDQQQRQQNVQNQNQQNVIRETEKTTIKQSSSGDLLWLVILFIVLGIIAAIILILCCICKQCPFYIAPKRRKITSADIVEKLVVKGSGQGRESKSVQVAEWFGRKEAWSADKEPVAVMIDPESESLRRHEMERGSDRGGVRQNNLRHQHVQQSLNMQHLNQQDNMRDQLYIREGNADILRLITRAGGEARRNSATFLDQQQQHYFVDSGKDILLKRFIDQQQAEAARAQVLLPNAVNKLQTEQEFLEASLRQQNALLRQLIMERERDLRLETQSLPAGTQTDKDRGTQTEPQYLRPPRRRVQSDLELSDDGSDEEIAIIKARAKRRHRIMKPRKIRTPIQEESEVEMSEKYESSYQQSSMERNEAKMPQIKQTRTSQLRQKRASIESKSSSTRSALRKDVLREITASLNQSDEEGYFDKYKTSPEEPYSDDSLEDISPRSDKIYFQAEAASQTRRRRSESLDREPPRRRSDTSLSRARYRSENDLRSSSSFKKSKTDPKLGLKKSQSHAELSSAPLPKKSRKGSSRYMEWYTKNKDSTQKAPKGERRKSETTLEGEKLKQPVVESRLFKETVSSSNKKADSSKKSIGPEHPLLQHSEHRFEVRYPKKRAEEDADSGIVLSKPEMAQKKSVFTIAYNDMHTRQLRPDSSINTP